jgi:hypothetical protein
MYADNEVRGSNPGVNFGRKRFLKGSLKPFLVMFVPTFILGCAMLHAYGKMVEVSADLESYQSASYRAPTDEEYEAIMADEAELFHYAKIYNVMAAAMGIYTCALVCLARRKLRAVSNGRYLATGSPCSDCCTSFFCSACVVCQMDRFHEQEADSMHADGRWNRNDKSKELAGWGQI